MARVIRSCWLVAGFAGIVLMGLKFETAVGEAHEVWYDDSVTPLGGDEADMAIGVRP